MGNATSKDYSKSISVGTNSRKTRWDGPGRSIYRFSRIIFNNLQNWRDNFRVVYIKKEEIRRCQCNNSINELLNFKMYLHERSIFIGTTELLFT